MLYTPFLHESLQLRNSIIRAKYEKGLDLIAVTYFLNCAIVPNFEGKLSGEKTSIVNEFLAFDAPNFNFKCYAKSYSKKICMNNSYYSNFIHCTNSDFLIG